MLSALLSALEIPPAHEPIITTGGQIILGVLALIGAQLEYTRRKVARTQQTVNEVAETTGSGGESDFAATVTAALGRIEGEQALLRREVFALREDDRRVWDYVTNHLPREGRS